MLGLRTPTKIRKEIKRNPCSVETAKKTLRPANIIAVEDTNRPTTSGMEISTADHGRSPLPRAVSMKSVTNEESTARSLRSGRLWTKRQEMETDSDGSGYDTPCPTPNKTSEVLKENNLTSNSRSRAANKRKRASEGDTKSRSGTMSSSSDESILTVNSASASNSTAKRGRGRPPTTGAYIGYGKAREDREKQRLDIAEDISAREIEDLARELTGGDKGLKLPEKLRGNDDDPSAPGLIEVGKQAVNVFEVMLDKSKRLKGTVKGEMKRACVLMGEVLNRIGTLTISEEARILHRENDSLKNEIRIMRERTEKIEKDLEECRYQLIRSTAETTSTSQDGKKNNLDADRFRAEILASVRNMMDANTESILSRLPPLAPEANLRTPYAADERWELSTTLVSPPTGHILNDIVEGKKNKRNKKKAKNNTDEDQPIINQKDESAHPAASMVTVANEDEGWNTAVKKGAKRREAKRLKEVRATGAPKTRSEATGSSKNAQEGKAKVRTRHYKLRERKTAAVVIDIIRSEQEKGVSFADILKQAKSAVNLKEIGIEKGLSFRWAVTGALVLELPQEAGAVEAQKLELALKQKLPDSVRVTRPIKKAEIRIWGMDDSVSREEIAAAAAEATGFSADDFSVGALRKDRMGMLASLVRCPVQAAKVLVERNRLCVGWSSAKIYALESRPLRCYHCMELGHTSKMCKNTDRTNQCFRCGKDGHIASDCNAKPHCTVCAAAGKSADHTMGGKICRPPLPKNHHHGPPRPLAVSSVPRAASREPVVEAITTEHDE